MPFIKVGRPILPSDFCGGKFRVADAVLDTKRILQDLASICAQESNRERGGFSYPGDSTRKLRR